MQFSTVLLSTFAALASASTSVVDVTTVVTTVVSSIIECDSTVTDCPGSTSVYTTTKTVTSSNSSNSTNVTTATVTTYTGGANNVYAKAGLVAAAGVAALLL